MGLRLKNQELGQCYFITTTFREHMSWGNTPGVYNILAKAINHQLRETQSKMIAYVFMPSHLHAILAISGKALPEFTRDFKKYTSQKPLYDIFRTKRIWQQRYDRQVIISEKVMRTKINYIHNNPVKAGLVKDPQEWKWSSASDYYCGRKGPVALWMTWNP